MKRHWWYFIFLVLIIKAIGISLNFKVNVIVFTFVVMSRGKCVTIVFQNVYFLVKEMNWFQHKAFTKNKYLKK